MKTFKWIELIVVVLIGYGITVSFAQAQDTTMSPVSVNQVINTTL